MYNINKPNIWFFKTYSDVNPFGVPPLRLLPEQNVPTEDGKFEPGDYLLKVKSPARIRTENPIGTLFFSFTMLPVQHRTNGKFYDIDSIGLSKLDLDIVSTEVKDAYEQYLNSLTNY